MNNSKIIVSEKDNKV